jgi:hypothetical protein
MDTVEKTGRGRQHGATSNYGNESTAKVEAMRRTLTMVTEQNTVSSSRSRRHAYGRGLASFRQRWIWG